jgi:methionyl-tRNA synthetase
VVHDIGKDILIPAHGVYWPVMLKALGFADEEMPTLLVHGWWNISGAKMSKSLGNSIDPDVLAERYGAEALRYYLMSDIVTGKDADFSEERLIQRYNTDLANSLGNLVNRSLNMTQKYRDGKLSRANADAGGSSYETQLESYRGAFGDYRISDLLQAALEIATACNQEIDERKPWSLAKHPELASRLDEVLYRLAESLRIIAILVSPVVPRAAHGIFDQLNWKLEESGKESRFRLVEAKWGGLPDSHVLGKPVPLFPRIEALIS